MIRLLVLLLSVFLLLSVAHAEDKEKSPTISPWVYKKLKKSESLIAKKSYQQAEKQLTSLLTDVKEKSYEQAIVLRSLSSVYALKGQYNKAAKRLAKAINLHVLPRQQKQQALLSLGQLYMAENNYALAIKTLAPWLASNKTNNNAQINVLVANAYAQLRKYRQALPYIKRAIASTKKPDESWYHLNLAIYYELKNYSSAATILKKLIRLHPDKKDYWDQLSSVYQQTKQYKKSVSIKQLAYKKGFIKTEKAILELVNLFLFVDSPYKAASLLQKELKNKRIKSNSKNWETLAQAWTMAKEFDFAISALETASKLNAKGRLYQQLGQIYVEQEKWPLAIKALNKAIGKGQLKTPGTNNLLLGMSHYELKNIKKAKKYFIKALQYNKTKKPARQWLGFIKDM